MNLILCWLLCFASLFGVLIEFVQREEKNNNFVAFFI